MSRKPLQNSFEELISVGFHRQPDAREKDMLRKFFFCGARAMSSFDIPDIIMADHELHKFGEDLNLDAAHPPGAKHDA